MNRCDASRRTPWLYIGLLSLCLSVFSVTAQANLLAEWRLDETEWNSTPNEVQDSSGNAHHGRAMNGLTSVAGKVCQAGWFRGEGFNAAPNNTWYTARYYIQVPHATELSPMTQGANAEMSLSGWIRPDSVSGTMTVLMKGNDSNSHEYHVFLENGQLQFTLWNHWGDSYTGSINYNLSAGQWYFFSFAAERQGNSNNVRLTGQLYSEQSNTPLATLDSGNQSIPLANKVSSGDLRIGAFLWSGNQPTHYFNGLIDELRLHDRVLTEAERITLKNTQRDCGGPVLQCFNDTFDREQLGNDWSATHLSGSFGNPRIVNQRLRMTNASANVATAATLQRLFPSADNLVTIEFDFFAYGGSGADGIAVVFSDAATTPAPGGYGGSLGYAQRSSGIQGFAGGWLGIALDTFGNFSNPTEGRQGGPGRRQHSVAMRGSGAGTSGYAYLQGTQTLSPTLRSTAGQRYRITIDSRTAGQSWVTVERDTGSGFAPLIGPVDILSSAGQAQVPENLLLTLTGSTGGSNDNHEIDNLEVCGLKMEPLIADVHHYRILHRGSGLTCAAEPIQVIACANDSCSSRFSGPASVTLSPASSGAVRWEQGPSGTLDAGEGQFLLRRNTSGNVTLGLSVNTPSAANVTRCFRQGIEGSCVLSFAESGFLMELPDLIAGKPDSFTLSARRASSSNPESCAPAFTGTHSVDFRSQYSNPATGSLPLRLNNQSISNTTGWTQLELTFDEQANAQVAIRYDDAGLKQLEARYSGAQNTIEQGLVLSGSGEFSSKPAGLCLETPEANAACEGDLADCSVFKIAGETFAMQLRGVRWTADDDPQLCDNPTTENYQQQAITVSAELVAPAGGRSAELSVSQMPITSGGSTTEELTLSEVGVFRFHAVPLAGNYFGRSVSPGTSAPIGRFIPSHFDLHYQVDSACLPGSPDAFSYTGLQTSSANQSAGQPFRVQGHVQALNLQNQPTHNYRDGFAKLTAEDLSGIPLRTPDGQSSGQFGHWNLSLQAFTQGRADFSLDTDLRMASRPHAPVQIYPQLSAADSDSVQGSSADMNAAQTFLSGRLTVGSRHAYLETAPINLPLVAEYFDGQRWARHTANSCSPLQLFRLDNDQAQNQTGSIAIATGSTEHAAGPFNLSAGEYLLRFSAPGEGNSGFTDVTPLLSDQPWLRYDWQGNGWHTDDPVGRAVWGLYRGNPAIIYQREIWR